MKKPTIFFYHDGKHPLIYHFEPPMSKEEYETPIDELAGTPVDAVSFCLGEGRVLLHDTKVGEQWGHNVDKWISMARRRTYLNVRGLIDEGKDPLRIVCDRAHHKGFLFYPSLIVQRGSDVRGETSLWERCSEFRFNNKHLEIRAKGNLPPGFPNPDNLDFMHEESRNERFAIIEEVLNNYPVDGFELQLQSNCHYFHPDEVDAGRPVLTNWIRQIHDAVKQSGEGRELIVRIPSDIARCESVGMDLREWVREGIVEALVGQDMEAQYRVNEMSDFRNLVELAKDSDCRVIATMQNHIDIDRYFDAPIEVTRAAACNYWEQDINGLLLFYWYLDWPYNQSFYEKLRELPYPKVMAPKDKYYHLFTNPRRTKPGEPGPNKQLPATLELSSPVALHLTISDDLPYWDEADRVHEVLLRIRVIGITETTRIRFKLNDIELPEEGMRKINQIYRMAAPSAGSGYWFVFKLDRGHWPLKGRNYFEVTLLDIDPTLIVNTYINDLELETKYLMGKNFQRGFVDQDLGPYDAAIS